MAAVLCFTSAMLMTCIIPKWLQIYGPESSGKTTLALHSIAEVQRAGGRALLIDAEHAFDFKYAQSLVGRDSSST